MNEDFVNYEVAKKLKEKGYPQHIADDAYIVDNYGEEDYQIGDRLPIPLIPDYMADVSAPRIDQVLKWLRKEKNLYITPTYITDSSMDAGLNICDEWCYWSFSVINLNDGSTMYDDYERLSVIEYKTYEQAAFAGIEYVLNNLI